MLMLSFLLAAQQACFAPPVLQPGSYVVRLSGTAGPAATVLVAGL